MKAVMVAIALGIEFLHSTPESPKVQPAAVSHSGQVARGCILPAYAKRRLSWVGGWLALPLPGGALGVNVFKFSFT